MKTSTKVMSGAFAIALAAITIATTSSAAAYRWDPSVQWHNYSADRHEAMTKAFEAVDYEAWKKLMDGKKGRVTSKINADNFAKFVEARFLAKEWKMEESKAIRTELGLWLRNGEWKGEWRGDRKGRRNGKWRGNRSWMQNWTWMKAGTSECSYSN